jgi:acyl carrier protein
MTGSLRETVVQAVADILGHDPAQLGDDSGLDVTAGWDSLQHLSIIMALEEELGVRVDPEDVTTHRTIGAISRLMARLTGS